MMNKVYLHIDLDAFFASVEQLDNPQLKGKPVIVGGKPGDRRAVVSTCSYEARKFGVHSAMPIFQAYRLCPNGIYIYPRMKRYHEKSLEVMNIFHEYSPDIQQISVDEAFIDLTGTEKLFGSPVETAKKIKKEVLEKTGLTVSVGLASTKYCAKIASGLNKPDGFFAVEDGKETEFMLSLPLTKLWGAGTKTLEKLNNSGIKTTKDIYMRSENLLKSLFGNATGSFLYNAVRGNEYEDFNEKPKSRSISAESTYEYDLISNDAIETALLELCNTVMFRSLKEKVRSRSVTLKIRYEDFSTVSIQDTRERYVSSIDDLFDRIKTLFTKKYKGNMGIRLLGVGLQNLEDDTTPRQEELFDFGDEKKRKVESAILKAEEKNPSLKIIKARLLAKNLIIPLLFLILPLAKPFPAEEKDEPEETTNIERLNKIRPKDSSKKSETNSDGAASIIFNTTNLPLDDSGEIVSLFSRDISGKNIDFLAEGYWRSTVTGSASYTFGFGSTPSYTLSTPVFVQNVDLTLWFMFDHHWYFEAAFADGFEKNTVAAGYVGEGKLKSARISNRNIIFPDIYSVSTLNRGIGGGDNQAPGISFSWSGKKWQADAAVRYDFLTTHEKSWYGKNSVSDSYIDLSKYNTGSQYVLPTAELVKDIKAIYVESHTGSYTDSSGTKYKKLNSSQYLLSAATNTITLSRDSKAYRQNGKLPAVAISFHGKIKQSDFGSYSNKTTFLGKVQEWFGSSVSLSKYSLNLFGNIAGEEVLFVQSSSGFSPFVNASRYDCGVTQAAEAEIASKTAKTSLSAYSAIIADTQVEFTSSDFFYTNHTYADVYLSELSKQSLTAATNPQVRFPLAKKNPGIYLGTTSNEDTALRIRTYTPVSRLEIGTAAISGTVIVYKNNIMDPHATYDSESGTISLSTGISSGDHIYATWSEESGDSGNASLAAAAGFKYDFTPNFSGDISTSARWSYSKDRSFADSTCTSQGHATAATSVSYSGENFSVKNTAGATLQNDNTSGTFRILSMDDLSPDTSYLPESAGVDLPEDFTPSLNERLKDGSENFPELAKSKNDVISNSSGVSDSGITGYAIPLSWNFTKNQENFAWAGRTISLPAAKSALPSCSQFSIAIKNTLPAVTDFDLYLQLGVSTSEDFNSENSSVIPTWKISEISSDVVNPFSTSSGIWQIVTVALSDYDRSILSICGNYGARLIAVPKNNNVTEANQVGTILAGPYELNLTSCTIESGEKVHVSAYEKLDPTLYSSKIKKLNKDSDGKSTKNYVQHFEWKYLESCSQKDKITLTKYFQEIDISKYKRLSFWIKYDSEKDSVISFTLGRPDSDSDSLGEKAVSFSIPSEKILPGWQKIVVNLDDKTAEISGSKVKAEVDDSVIPVRLKIEIESENPSKNDSGELSIDEIYISGNSPYIILQDTITSEWKKDGEILAIGNHRLLSDVLISGSANGERAFETNGSNQKGSISGSGHVSGTLANIKIALDGSKDTQTKTENPLASAHHLLETDAPILKVLSLKEEFSFNEPEETLEKNNAISLSLSPLRLPLNLSGKFFADSNAYSRSQKMSAQAAFSKSGFHLGAKALASQKILSSSDAQEMESDSYIQSWKELSAFEFSAGDKNASKREVNLSTTTSYSSDFLKLNPSITYSLRGNYKNSSEIIFTDTANMIFSIPFSIAKNRFELAWKKSASTVKSKDSGGNYAKDMADVKKGMASEKWFYRTFPVYDLASTRLAKQISKTPDYEDENDSGKNILSSSYSCEYSFNWKRAFFGDRYDFFIPSGNSISFSRDIVASTSLSDIYQLKDTVRYSALNIFGSRGSIPILKIFEQDEYASSLSAAVKIPRKNPGDKTYYCSGYFQSTFYITDKNSITSGIEGTFQTKEDWSGKYTFIWKRNAKHSASASLANLALKKFKGEAKKDFEITKYDSVNFSMSSASSSDDVTRKYAAEYAHQTDSQITKFVTVHSSMGLSYSTTWKESVTLGATASLGATIRF